MLTSWLAGLGWHGIAQDHSELHLYCNGTHHASWTRTAFELLASFHTQTYPMLGLLLVIQTLMSIPDDTQEAEVMAYVKSIMARYRRGESVSEDELEFAFRQLERQTGYRD
eukprot:366490-Chlamydomonas_euryale.AAC.8